MPPLHGFENAPTGLLGHGFRRPEVQADPYTVLYAPFNGVDEATSFVDLTGRHTLTAVGTAKLDDSVAPPFGTTALALDGSGARVTIPDSADFAFGSGDWTIDFFFRPANAALNSVMFAVGSDTNNRFYGGYNTGDPSFSFYAAGVVEVGIGAADIVLSNTWHHYGLERFGNDWNLYLDGAKVATATKAIAVPDYSSNLVLGSDTGAYPGGATNSNARIMNFRIRKGHAAYRGNNFTPPTTFYPGFDA
jgi:hypothetical protein